MHRAFTGDCASRPLPSNRRYILERLESEIGFTTRNDSSFCIALADLDHFKTINDTFGHGVGDIVLCEIAHRLQNSTREYDVCARWGGEEFLILFPRTTASDTFALAERLRVSAMAPVNTESGPITITVSIGVTGFRIGESLDRTLVRVDRALYQAKAEDRNRVVLI